jgi:hypothetical protein
VSGKVAEEVGTVSNELRAGASSVARETGRGKMGKSEDLERELRDWREARVRKQTSRPVTSDRRTLRVNGREVVVVTKPKRNV